VVGKLGMIESWGLGHIDLMGPMVDRILKIHCKFQMGPITRSRAKKIKEAMQGLVQSTWLEFANLSSKTPTFKMRFKEE
jgi:hypothetical protein